MTGRRTRLVWDLPLRVFHWLLVLSVLASWITGQIGYDVRQYHMWLGYWMIGLLGFRIAWGFVGTRHARFASFVPTPRSVIRFTRHLLRGTPSEHAGHDPLGALMVFLMLALLSIQVTSGLFIDDDIFYAGPFNASVSESTAELFETLHHTVVDVIVALAVLHVAAIGYYTVRRKQRLIHAMIDGRKSDDVVDDREAIDHSAIVRALIVVVLVAAAVYWLVAIAP